MTVKLRAVNACELDFAADQESAGTAHACAVDHYRVHGNDCGNAELLCELASKLHHDDRSDNDAVVVADTLIPELLEGNADVAVDSVRSVVSCEIKVLSDCLHLVFENKELLGPCTLDAVDFDAVVVEPLELVIYGSCSDASCDEEDLLSLKFFNGKIAKIGGVSERAYNICKALALIHSAHSLGLSANCLVDDRDDALFAVEVANGKRNSLSVLISSYDQELAGHGLLCNERSFDLHEENLGTKHLLGNDLKHILYPP